MSHPKFNKNQQKQEVKTKQITYLAQHLGFGSPVVTVT
jgi:hypothetical protein